MPGAGIARFLFSLAREFQETADPRVIWEAHFAGIENRYWPHGQSWRALEQ